MLAFIADDHAVLMSDDFRGFIPKQLTVRTVTKDGKESTDSEVVRLPQNLIQEVTAGAAKAIAAEASVKAGLRVNTTVFVMSLTLPCYSDCTNAETELHFWYSNMLKIAQFVTMQFKSLITIIQQSNKEKWSCQSENNITSN